MESKGKRAEGAAGTPIELSLDRIDQVLERLPREATKGRGRPRKEAGPQAMICQRLDQIEAVIEQGVAAAAIARELGMSPATLASYMKRARNMRAGLTQDGKPRAPKPGPGEHWSPAARRAFREQQLAEAGLAPKPQQQPEPQSTEPPAPPPLRPESVADSRRPSDNLQPPTGQQVRRGGPIVDISPAYEASRRRDHR